jgi:hypothetical protein
MVEAWRAITTMYRVPELFQFKMARRAP